MKRISLAFFLFVSLLAHIKPTESPFETRFTESELVCRGKVLAISLPSNQVLSRNGKMLPVDYVIQVLPSRYYKGQASSPYVQVVLTNLLSPPSGVGKELLLFLISSGNNL